MAKGHLAETYGGGDEDGHYSDLQVLQSAAGFYIGTIFHGNDGFDEPGSRESEYFPTREKAEDALASMSFEQRENP